MDFSNLLPFRKWLVFMQQKYFAQMLDLSFRIDFYLSFIFPIYFSQHDWVLLSVDQKLCVQYNLLPIMLIRHINIPRNSHLVPLAQPKNNQSFEDTNDYASYFSKTLNPELPISNTLTSQRQGSLHQSSKEMLDASFSHQTHEKQLSRQFPQRIDEIPVDLNLSPRKQNYINRSWQVENPEQGHRLNQLKSRFPTFSNNMPHLCNNAYLNSNLHNNAINNPHSNQDITNFSYIQSGSDQSQEVISNKHVNKLSKNREVYRTLERFKAKKSDQMESSRLRSHKKYTFDPPKQNFIHPATPVPSASHSHPIHPEPQTNQPLHKEVQRKQTRLGPISGRTVNQYVSSPSFSEKNKKMMPQQEEQVQISPLKFNKQTRKSFSLRKTSQQETTPAFTPKSQVHFSNKMLLQKPPKKKWSQKINPSVIEVSCRTSLTKVRQICEIAQLQKHSIVMKIPQIFAYPLFSGNQSQQQLFNKADQALRHLQVSRKTISIKKFSNCVVILSASIGIVWHYTGKVYFGGWKHEMLDEGAKQGLGLQWAPKKYVYYGEFNRNKRDGIGIMKTSEKQILAGLWRDNHFIRSLAFNVDNYAPPKQSRQRNRFPDQ